MSGHVHDFGTGWPFDDAENTAIISCRHVLDGSPVLLATHDEDDGGWQLLCGQPHEVSDGRIACLGCIVARDPSLVELADLGLGWYAERDAPDAPWMRAPNPSAADET
jgi:hypothetical protein